MPEHIHDWVNAYVDGELRGARLADAELHLVQCAECRAEVDAMQALSAVLKEAALPEFMPADRFVANTVLSVPRQPRRSRLQKNKDLVWWSAPAGLMVVWLLTYVLLTVSNWMNVADSLNFLPLQNTAWFGQAAAQESIISLALTEFDIVTPNIALFFDATFSYITSVGMQVGWQIALTISYLIWVASWWVRRSQFGQSLDATNGSLVG